MGKNDNKDIVKISKKANLAVTNPGRKKKKNRNTLIYEYIICSIALIGTVLAVIDIFRGLNTWQQWADRAILAVLAADYLVRFILAKNKKEFFLENILILIAILPFSSLLRVFRVTRLAKLMRLSIIGAFPRKAFRKVGTFLNTNGLKNMLILTLLAILFGSFGVMYTEGMTFGNAIWWAFVTATTVGYGDLSPRTTPGRLIAAILMIFGIGLIGSITSTITSYFLRQNNKTYREETLELIKKKIDDISSLSDDDIDAICKVLKTLNK
jgi:voltage-gated potassium channel